MAEQEQSSNKIPLVVQLTAELAARLKTAAESRGRTPAELAAELLDRHVPRPPAEGPKKCRIPYA